ncbi:MAG: SulP family inorganic anion transporter [Pirellulaceae bacterium]|nr:SulP family inorganic anion transporter [Pirellulaceae bacterium]
MSQPTPKPAAASAATWRRDLLASLVVFLVALPLCMGIALASGAPVAAGLVTGIVGGLIVGFLAGSPLQVSGPAAGLTVICGEIIREHGLPALGLIVMIGGAIQLAAGLFKLGQWFRAVSPSVIHGMLSGIGVLILSSQLHVMVDDRPRGSGLANLWSIPEAIAKGLPLPTLESAEQRQARIDFLQRFAAIHERQTEIEAHAARIVSRQGSVARHAQEAAQLGDYLGPQRTVREEFRAARDALIKSPLGALAGPRAEQLNVALDATDNYMARALTDLQGNDPQQASAALTAAKQALENVLGSLKSHDWAAKVGIFSIVLIVLWQTFAPANLRVIPAPLLAVATATLAAWCFSLPVLYVEVPDRLYDGLIPPSLNVFIDVAPRDLLVSGLMLAIIASAETLLCATAVDRMHSGPRTHYDRELAAQGVGNLICGLVGALPMTGVIVRSAANVQAGAGSRLSAILHGAWLLTFVVLCGPLLRMIPTAALAGILVYTGFRLIDFKGFIHHWHASRVEALILLATLVTIVTADLLTGVITGIVLSAVKLLVTFSQLDVRVITSSGRSGPNRTIVQLAGAATFLRLPVLAAKLEKVPADAEVVFETHTLRYIDEACLELLDDWVRQRVLAGGTVAIKWSELHHKLHLSPRDAEREQASQSSAA